MKLSVENHYSFYPWHYVISFWFLLNVFQSASEAPCDGNMFLNRLAGADVYIAPRKSPYATELKPRMEQLAEKIK